jgi:tetratricopeptide (TPR) repeat protein
LSEYPGDPVARGTLGAFYYFADTLPGLFKFLSRLVFMPTGDREKGLQYIQSAAGAESIFKTDLQITLYTVYFMFEGRYEDGIDGIRKLSNLHPRYVRLACPSYIMRPLMPQLAAVDEARVGALIEVDYGGSNDRFASHSANLLHFLRAYSGRFYGEPSLAADDFRALIIKNKNHPDWAGGYAKLELGRMMASQGRPKEAHRLFEEVGAPDAHEYLRDTARDMLKDLEKYGAPSKVPDKDWIAGIYRSAGADRRETISYLENIERHTLHVVFYLGDALLLEGHLDRAEEAFEAVLRTGAPRWDQEYQMLAACRAAEIHGARGDYRSAARTLSRALDYYHREYLMDWIIEGRQRYYERLADGREKITPTLFCSTPQYTPVKN